MNQIFAVAALCLSLPLQLRAETREVQGWTVHVDDSLLKPAERAATEHAVDEVGKQLATIVRMVPPEAVAELRKVPLWVSPEYPGVRPRAEYHPGGEWLREHGRNPEMAKGVEFTNVRIIDAEVKRMPVFVLHELAHAYHDRVLGFENVEIAAAYERAKASGSYEKVEREGTEGRPGRIERAYAMTNAKEYFAETTEAFFGHNDFYPFTRDDLRRHDPEMERLLARLWQAR